MSERPMCPYCGASVHVFGQYCSANCERADDSPEAPPLPDLDDPKTWEGINQELAGGGDASPIGAEKRGPLGTNILRSDNEPPAALPAAHTHVYSGTDRIGRCLLCELDRLAAENQRLREAAQHHLEK